ncbi:hypothetical protein B0H15DRAFT_799762 [Mycena belliarum]|uniref:Uncharacterized protein n=1 Tax=Mycena belliarum TaxID=1033014 RepID=A0AAD6XSF2_9AGAR|nr:hypothetical protein B0H15DRAFT_799762 [Mycena belliae]
MRDSTRFLAQRNAQASIVSPFEIWSPPPAPAMSVQRLANQLDSLSQAVTSNSSASPPGFVTATSKHRPASVRNSAYQSTSPRAKRPINSAQTGSTGASGYNGSVFEKTAQLFK